MKINQKSIAYTIAAGVTLAMAVTSASAADLVMPAKPVAAYNWTGFYAGVDAGGVFGRTDQFNFLNIGTSSPHSLSGAAIGGFIGYNYQIQNYVIGGEADASWVNYHGKTNCPNAAFTCSTNASSLESIRARAGYAFDRALLYGTAGIGFGTFKYRTYTTATGVNFNTPYNITKVGFTLGAGLEYALTDNWLIRGEYLYYGFGSNTDSGQLDGVITPTKVRSDASVIRIGAAYKF